MRNFAQHSQSVPEPGTVGRFCWCHRPTVERSWRYGSFPEVQGPGRGLRLWVFLNRILHPTHRWHITTAFLIRWRKVGSRMSFSNWRVWHADATLRSTSRTKLMWSARLFYYLTRSRAIVVKSFWGVRLSGMFRSKKKDDPSRLWLSQYCAMVCAMALFPAPATSDNQKISTPVDSSAK